PSALIVERVELIGIVERVGLIGNELSPPSPDSFLLPHTSYYNAGVAPVRTSATTAAFIRSPSTIHRLRHPHHHSISSNKSSTAIPTGMHLYPSSLASYTWTVHESCNMLSVPSLPRTTTPSPIGPLAGFDVRLAHPSLNNLSTSPLPTLVAPNAAVILGDG
ncbi:unnamed protein product, partial [Tilletia controversa]